MHFRSYILLLLLTASLLAKAGDPVQLVEDLPDKNLATIQAMRARAEAARMEEEFRNPKKPEIKKGRAVEGNLNAPILLVEYSDFQCPYCREGFITVEALRKKYGSKIAFVFKNLPLPMHPMALPAALRFEAIAMQNAKKAYEFHNQVFENQNRLTSDGETFLDETAKKMHVNMAKMKKDMNSDTVQKRLRDDQNEAGKFEIVGTPGFIVSGVTLKGAYPIEMFEQIIDRRLKEQRKIGSN